MTGRAQGVWAGSVAALTLLLLASMLAVAVPLGLVASQIEAERQAGVALAFSELLSSALLAQGPEGTRAGLQRAPELLASLQSTSLELDELYVVDASGGTLASVAGAAPPAGDDALRAALERREQTVARVGPRWFPEAVVVTSPLGAGPVGALRVRLPVQGHGLSGLGLGAALVIPTLGLLPVVFFTGWVWLRRTLVRPIQALRDGTRRIAQGQFGHQLQVRAPAELEELRDDLNALSVSLERYRARTRRQVARLKRANAELARAQDALIRSEKLAGLGRLAAGLAHEVGNPLSAVLGFQELLAEGLEDPRLREPELERELVTRSRRELERIHRTLRQLLDYARAGPGVAEDVPPAAALEGAIATVRAVPAVRGLTVGAEAEPELPPVRIERDKLHQVLVNLLLNAADALAETRTVGGTLPGTVRLVARAVPESGRRKVEIRCEDTGPGFSAAALAHAFEPFFTSKAEGKGTGLGLATCQQVVEAAGGSIKLENRPEGGATVRIELPAAEDRA